MTDAKGTKPKLLSGGNPQIPKGDGPGPVRDYLTAMPGWKRKIGKRLDALLAESVPDVRKAVRWNQPYYGSPDAPDDHWFASFRCYTSYVQLQLLQGTSLDPMPPKESKHDEVRYLDIHEDDEIKDDQLRSWFRQAAALPGSPL